MRAKKCVRANAARLGTKINSHRAIGAATWGRRRARYTRGGGTGTASLRIKPVSSVTPGQIKSGTGTTTAGAHSAMSKSFSTPPPRTASRGNCLRAVSSADLAMQQSLQGLLASKVSSSASAVASSPSSRETSLPRPRLAPRSTARRWHRARRTTGSRWKNCDARRQGFSFPFAIATGDLFISGNFCRKVTIGVLRLVINTDHDGRGVTGGISLQVWNTSRNCNRKCNAFGFAKDRDIIEQSVRPAPARMYAATRSRTSPLVHR
jgi:hypothetical protein